VVTGVCSALLPSRFACCMRDWSFVALALGGNLTLYSLFVPAVLVACWEEEWHKEGNGGWPLLPSRIWGRADTRRKEWFAQYGGTNRLIIYPCSQP
jgi:hypothetical protein